MLQYPGHEARARVAQSTGGVEEHRRVVLVETYVQVVTVACPFQVRFRGHSGLEPHPVGHTPDRLEHHHALVRRANASSSPTESSRFPCPTSAWHCSGLMPICSSVWASSATNSAAEVSA